ncbi:uncharacterized protein LOC126840754 [Adelges cooleyi]|uniref:uncharacterized protein LOC126840754 n=1 Tax=Adelges cooleyi TaxID=133065 RepID=UPI0021803CB0|nr:uncharacterized protein LOC126840754 [Adelges cooleyi]
MLPKNSLWRFLATRGHLVRNLNSLNKTTILAGRGYSKKSESDFDVELNKPVKYTASAAYQWKAENSRVGSKAEFGPWYEAHLVSASVAVFLIYFCVLREENDIDQFLERPLAEMGIKKD